METSLSEQLEAILLYKAGQMTPWILVELRYNILYGQDCPSVLFLVIGFWHGILPDSWMTFTCIAVFPLECLDQFLNFKILSLSWYTDKFCRNWACLWPCWRKHHGDCRYQCSTSRWGSRAIGNFCGTKERIWWGTGQVEVEILKSHPKQSQPFV